MPTLQFLGIRGLIAVGLAVALGLCWLGWNRAAEKRDQYKADLAAAEATIAFLEADAKLKESAAIERSEDTAEVAEMEKELIDAIKSVPDSKPGPARVALGCERLRRAGTSENNLPAVCRPDSGSEASSRP